MLRVHTHTHNKQCIRNVTSWQKKSYDNQLPPSGRKLHSQYHKEKVFLYTFQSLYVPQKTAAYFLISPQLMK